MFSSDRNIETLSRLAADMKAYVELRLKALRLDFTAKLTLLASQLIFGLVVFVLGCILFALVCVMCIVGLAPYVGGTLGACAIMGGVCVMLALVIYKRRKAWITDPVANFLGQLFLDEEEDSNVQE